MNTQDIIMDYEKLLSKDDGVNLSTSYFSYNHYNNHKLALELSVPCRIIIMFYKIKNPRYHY